MKSFYIEGTKPSNHPFPIISWLIRLFTWSPISHVLMDFIGEEEVFHVYFNEIRFEDRDKYLDSVKVVYRFRIDVTPDMYGEIVETCEDFVGQQKGYYWHLIGLIPSLFLGNKIRNYFAERNKSKICSQLIAEVLSLHLHPNLFKGLNLHNFSELDLIKKLKDNEGDHRPSPLRTFIITEIL